MQLREKGTPLHAFSDNIPMFSAELFQNTLMKSSVMEFSRVLAVDYSPVFYQKVAPPKGQFLEFVGGEIIQTKKSL